MTLNNKQLVYLISECDTFISYTNRANHQELKAKLQDNVLDDLTAWELSAIERICKMTINRNKDGFNHRVRYTKDTKTAISILKTTKHNG